MSHNLKAPQGSARGHTGSSSSLASPLAQNRMRSVIGGGAGAAGVTVGGDGLQSGGSFLHREGSMRSGAAGGPVGGGGAASKTSNFSKMVSGRASMRLGKGGAANRTGMGDERSSGSGRRSRKKKKEEQARIIIDGRDVTPQPLAYYGGGAAMHAIIASQLQQGVAPAPSVIASESSDMADAGMAGLLGSLAHGGISGVSVSESEYGMGSVAANGIGASGTSGGPLDADRDWGGGNAALLGLTFEYATDGHAAAAPRAKEWTDKELREKHTIKLEETDTQTLLWIPSTRIWAEDEVEAAAAQRTNRDYLHVLEKHKEKDKYCARSVQTLHASSRDKEVQVAPPPTRSAACDATTWDIFDQAQRLERQVAAASAGGPGAATVPRIQHESDLLARTAHMARSNAAAAAAAAASAAGGQSRATGTDAASGSARDDDDDDFAAGLHSIESARGGGGGGSSTNSATHSAQQSFLGAAGRSGINASRSGGANASWHQNLSTGGSGMPTGRGSTTSMAIAGGGSVATIHSMGAGGAVSGVGGGAGVGGGGPLDKVFQKASFARALRALEQGVLQTNLHTAQMLYRNHPEADTTALAQAAAPASPTRKVPSTSSSSLASMEEEKKSHHAEEEEHGGPSISLEPHAPLSASMQLGSIPPSLLPLWSFSCPLTEGLHVSCLSWNTQNGDLLAAGYGSVEFGHASRDRAGNVLPGIRVPTLPTKGGSRTDRAGGGMIAFWSLQNPSYPQKIFHTKHGVTALDFCEEHPHLLAAGLYDGSVAIYDVRDHGSKPALEAAHHTGKHREAVWGVKWVCKELHKRSQQLMSISTDGSVKQWAFKKGLVPHELMQLKRMPNRAALQSSSASQSTNSASGSGSAATMEGVSRDASGLCFDFPVGDGTHYFAGTEDGLLHKCSVSYNEQTLDTYYGHTGPVYRVRCSPFLPDAFLSCSEDWSAMLWSQKHSGGSQGLAGRAVLKFSAGGHDAIQDIAWSPNCSTLFGLVSREGRVEIWDLAVSPLDPIVKWQMAQVSPAALAAKEARVAEAQAALAAAQAAALTSGGHGDGNGLDSPVKGGGASAAAAAAVTAATAQLSAAQAYSPPRRFLSCISFSAHAPVLLVGTSDGSIELFRVEGTPLTSVAPARPAGGSDSGAPAAATAATASSSVQSYGQELNALTVMQVPRDRDRHSEPPQLQVNGVSTSSVVGAHSLDAERSQLALQQELMAKFREQARKLEAIMEQHVDSKSQTHEKQADQADQRANICACGV